MTATDVPNTFPVAPNTTAHVPTQPSAAAASQHAASPLPAPCSRPALAARTWHPAVPARRVRAGLRVPRRGRGGIRAGEHRGTARQVDGAKHDARTRRRGVKGERALAAEM